MSRTTSPSSSSSSAPTAHRRARCTAAAAATAVLVLLPVAAASAHVRVFPDTTEAGGYPVLTFRVPTESDTASTTRVEVTLPTDHPFTFAAVQPVPGWTAVVTEADLPAPVDVDGATITKAPRTVTWTADDDGAGIAPGQFQRFAVLAGPLPEAGTTVSLPATQTYSDGTVVAWDQLVPAGGEEPEEPAPVLTTTEAAASGDVADAAPSAAPASATTGDAAASSDGGSGPALWLGLTGAVLGAAALVVSLLRRRPGAAS